MALGESDAPIPVTQLPLVTLRSPYRSTRRVSAESAVSMLRGPPCGGSVTLVSPVSAVSALRIGPRRRLVSSPPGEPIGVTLLTLVTLSIGGRSSFASQACIPNGGKVVASSKPTQAG
jgi:hypothetical protein